MRSVEEFVADYRRKGYPDDRIRIIASMRPEPLRSEVLKLLESAPAQAAAPAEEVTQSEAAPAADPTLAPVETAEPAPVAAVPAAAPVAAAPVPEAPPAPNMRAVQKELSSVKKEAAALQTERDKLAAQMKKSQEEFEKERQKIAAQIQKSQAEMARLKADGDQVKDLRAQAGQLENVRKELADARAEMTRLIEARQSIEKRLNERELALIQKDTVLAEKDATLRELHETLSKERKEREGAVARAGELASKMEEQSVRLRQLDAAQEQISKAGAELASVKNMADRLKESEQAKSERIDELEKDLSEGEEQHTQLRDQIQTQEQAVEELQEKITARESELETLRTHFEREATDLHKRAEQEMWLIQRRLQRVKRMAAMGGAVAAGIIAIAVYGLMHVTSVAASDRAALAALSGNGQAQPNGLARTANAVRNAHLYVPPPVQPSRVQQPINVLNITSPTTTLAPAKRYTEYTVRRGDSLRSISRRLLGTENNWTTIARENGISLADADKIQVGQKLKIPVSQP